MNTCQKCGMPLLAGSKFCGRCGTAVDALVKQICPKCKSEVADGMIFCNKCGERLIPLAVVHAGSNNRTRTLIISRESQFQCATNSYKVVVNGNVLGKVPVGGAVRTNTASDTATVEIICTTIMVDAQRQLALRLGENPRVSFKVQWPGTIMETVYDAEVLERR